MLSPLRVPFPDHRSLDNAYTKLIGKRLLHQIVIGPIPNFTHGFLCSLCNKRAKNYCGIFGISGITVVFLFIPIQHSVDYDFVPKTHSPVLKQTVFTTNFNQNQLIPQNRFRVIFHPKLFILCPVLYFAVFQQVFI